MSGTPTQSNSLKRDEPWSALADLLACPVCHGTFAMEAHQLVCTQCGRTYPVVEGIPVLIPGS